MSKRDDSDNGQPTAPKKLLLKKEMIRELTTDELDQVHGGRADSNFPSDTGGPSLTQTHSSSNRG